MCYIKVDKRSYAQRQTAILQRCFTTTPPAALLPRRTRRATTSGDWQGPAACASPRSVTYVGSAELWAGGQTTLQPDALRRSPNEAEDGKNREAASAHRDLDVRILLDVVSQRAVFAAFAYTPSQSSSARCRALDGADTHRDLRAVSSSSAEVRYQLGA